MKYHYTVFANSNLSQNKFQLYHASRVSNLSKDNVSISKNADVGLHCGTLDQADSRAKNMHLYIYEIIIAPTKILTIDEDLDSMWDDPRSWMYAVNDPKLQASFCDTQGGHNGEGIRTVLLDNGYDVVEYPNEIEGNKDNNDHKKYSYIVLTKDVIVSIQPSAEYFTKYVDYDENAEDAVDDDKSSENLLNPDVEDAITYLTSKFKYEEGSVSTFGYTFYIPKNSIDATNKYLRSLGWRLLEVPKIDNAYWLVPSHVGDNT